MNISIKSGMILRFIKTIYYNRKFYIQEPMLILKIGKIFKAILKSLMDLGNWPYAKAYLEDYPKNIFNNNNTF